MKSIEEFLRINGLRQVDLARFLGITEGSVSKMVNGKTKPSAKNYRKLMDNDQGWDTTPLRIINPEAGLAEKVDFLRRENLRLREENEKLRKERDEFWQVIKNLSVPAASPNPSTTAPKELNNK